MSEICSGSIGWWLIYMMVLFTSYSCDWFIEGLLTHGPRYCHDPRVCFRGDMSIYRTGCHLTQQQRLHLLFHHKDVFSVKATTKAALLQYDENFEDYYDQGIEEDDEADSTNDDDVYESESESKKDSFKQNRNVETENLNDTTTQIDDKTIPTIKKKRLYYGPKIPRSISKYFKLKTELERKKLQSLQKQQERQQLLQRKVEEIEVEPFHYQQGTKDAVDFLRDELGLSQSRIASQILHYPGTIRYVISNKARRDSIIEVLQQFGFKQLQIRRLLRRNILIFSLFNENDPTKRSTLLERLSAFRQLYGLTRQEVIKLIMNRPMLLGRTIERDREIVQSLREKLLSEEDHDGEEDGANDNEDENENEEHQEVEYDRAYDEERADEVAKRDVAQRRQVRTGGRMNRMSKTNRVSSITRPNKGTEIIGRWLRGHLSAIATPELIEQCWDLLVMDLDLSPSDARNILLRTPTLINRQTIETFDERVEFFMDELHISPPFEDIQKVMKRNPNLLLYSVEKRLRPNAEFLIDMLELDGPTSTSTSSRRTRSDSKQRVPSRVDENGEDDDDDDDIYDEEIWRGSDRDRSNMGRRMGSATDIKKLRAFFLNHPTLLTMSFNRLQNKLVSILAMFTTGGDGDRVRDNLSLPPLPTLSTPPNQKMSTVEANIEKEKGLPLISTNRNESATSTNTTSFEQLVAALISLQRKTRIKNIESNKPALTPRQQERISKKEAELELIAKQYQDFIKKEQNKILVREEIKAERKQLQEKRLQEKLSSKQRQLQLKERREEIRRMKEAGLDPYAEDDDDEEEDEEEEYEDYEEEEEEEEVDDGDDDEDDESVDGEGDEKEFEATKNEEAVEEEEGGLQRVEKEREEEESVDVVDENSDFVSNNAEGYDIESSNEKIVNHGPFSCATTNIHVDDTKVHCKIDEGYVNLQAIRHDGEIEAEQGQEPELKAATNTSAEVEDDGKKFEKPPKDENKLLSVFQKFSSSQDTHDNTGLEMNEEIDSEDYEDEISDDADEGDFDEEDEYIVEHTLGGRRYNSGGRGDDDEGEGAEEQEDVFDSLANDFDSFDLLHSYADSSSYSQYLSLFPHSDDDDAYDGEDNDDDQLSKLQMAIVSIMKSRPLIQMTADQALQVIRHVPYLLSYRQDRTQRILLSLAVTLGLSPHELGTLCVHFPRLLCLNLDHKLTDAINELGMIAQQYIALCQNQNTSTTPGNSAIPLIPSNFSVEYDCNNEEDKVAMNVWRNDTVRTLVRYVVLKAHIVFGLTAETIAARGRMFLNHVIAAEGEESWEQLPYILRLKEEDAVVKLRERLQRKLKAKAKRIQNELKQQAKEKKLQEREKKKELLLQKKLNRQQIKKQKFIGACYDNGK